MKALIDTDVILDIFLQRMPFVIAASALWISLPRRISRATASIGYDAVRDEIHGTMAMTRKW